MTAALAIPQVEIDREWIARRGLAEFVRRAWGEVEPSAPLVWSWHLEAICEHLAAVSRREIHDLVINVPPGCSKSLGVSVLWPAWVWTWDPGHRWIAASYSERVAYRDADKMRELVKGEWYRGLWPEVEVPQGRGTRDAVSMFKTTAGGFRFTTTVRGQLTGEHGDTMVIDDPIDPQGAAAVSGRELDEVLFWWNSVAQTRFRDHDRSARVCIMQRLHQRDLSAEMRRQGATVLCLPMRFDPGHPDRWRGDPRTRPGELLVPARISEPAVRRLERVLGVMQAAAQLGQRPAPPGGSIFKQADFQYWTELPPGGEWLLSMDCAFKKTEDSSFVVVQAWYRCEGRFYLVDQHRARMDFPASVKALVAMARRYPKAFRKLVEGKANGPAVVAVLKGKLPGLVEIEPDGGKEARAHAVSPLVEAHDVYLPDPERARYDDGRVGARWVTESEPEDPTPGGFVGEVTVFPRAATNDQTDTMTQALNHLASRHASRLAAAMASL